jgi:hypothetical protein
LANPVLAYTDELLIGWLIRSSEAQGYRKIALIEELVGTDLESMERGEWADAVAAMLDANVGEVRYRARRGEFLAGTAYRKAAARVQFFGHDFRDSHLSKHAPVCPACLEEKAYLRNVWGLSFYAICARHRLWLIERCPDCDQWLTYRRSSILKCACGASLLGLSKRQASVESVRVSSFIEAAFDPAPQMGSSVSVIDGLGLSGRLDLIGALSMGRIAPAAATFDALLSKWQVAGPSNREENLDHVGSLLDDWPAALEAELFEAGLALPKGASMLRKISPSAMSWNGLDLAPDLQFLDELVERTARRRWSHYLIERSANGARRPETISQKADLQETMPVGDAAVLLGTDVRTIVRLFPTWHLKRSPGLNGRPTSPRLVLRGSIMELQRQLGQACRPWVDDPTSQYLTFDEAMHRCKLLNIRRSSLVDALAGGTIRICTDVGSRFSFQRAFINDTDYVAFLRQSVPDQNRQVRADVARQLLKLNVRTFEQLVERGMLPLKKKAEGPDDRKVALKIIFGLYDEIRLLHRIEDFCGLGKEALQRILNGVGTSLLASPANVGSGRHLRIALRKTLAMPRVFEILKEGAERNWLSSDDRTKSP